MSLNRVLRMGWSLVLLTLLATPALAGSGIIYNGADIWKTPGDGTSWQDFSNEPIPAGFFCGGSEPFVGQIVWEGRPLLTSPPDALGGADTILYRLDDAVFNDKGVAVTRLQMRALSLASVEPIQTSCGAYDARAALSGTQPITEMVIKLGKKDGGQFEAALKFNVKLTFTPVDDLLGETLELERQASFESGSGFFWSHKPQDLSKPGEDVPLLKIKGFVLVDTDGNDKADTFLPGTSNFFPYGKRVEVEAEDKAAFPPQQICQDGCHLDFGVGCHCPYPIPQEQF